MTEEKETPVNSENGKKPNKRIWLWAAVILVVIFGFAAFVSAVLFTSPRKVALQQPDSVDINRQINIASKLYMQIYRNPDLLCSMKLKENEINSLIVCAVFCHEKFNKKSEKISPADLRLKYSGGLFYGVLPLDTGIRILNGGVLEIHFAVRISKVQDKFFAEVVKVKAGKLDLPADKVNAKVKEYLAGEKAKKQLAVLNDVLEDITPMADGRLKITYYPRNLMRVVMQQIKHLQTGAL